MDVLVYRLFDGGRLQPKQNVWASEARGSLTVKEEDDAQRHRRTLVARLGSSSYGFKSIPPLYDVSLIEIGEWLTITGYERVLAGPLQLEHVVGQTWWCKLGKNEDLERAENEWRRLARELEALKSGQEGAGGHASKE